MYQTGPSGGAAVGILAGANTALGGVLAESIAAEKAKKDFLGFANVLEQEGLIGDAMIYRQAAASESPDFITAARTGQAKQRDYAKPFEHALRALESKANRESREATAASDNSQFSRVRTAYNAEDEIDSAELQVITSEINGIDNRRYALQTRLTDAQNRGDVAMVDQLEADLKELDARDAELRSQQQNILGGRRQRSRQVFGGELPSDPNSTEVPTARAGGASAPGELIPAGMAGADNLDQLPFQEETEEEGIISEEAINGSPRANNTQQAQADAFAGKKASVTETPNPQTEDGRMFSSKYDSIIPPIKQEVPAEKVDDVKSNEELARNGELDYTKHLGIPSDSSPRKVAARKNFLVAKQQAFIQTGRVYNEAIDKAQTPEQLKTAMTEFMRSQRKLTGLNSEASAKEAGDRMMQAMGDDAKHFVPRIERKGENNYDVDLVKIGAASVTKSNQTWILKGKLFMPDSTGAMVRVNPETGEETPLMSLNPDNEGKRLSYTEFENMVTQFSAARLAEILGVTLEEAEVMRGKIVGQGPKVDRAINKGASSTAEQPKRSVFQQFNQ